MKCDERLKVTKKKTLIFDPLYNHHNHRHHYHHHHSHNQQYFYGTWYEKKGYICPKNLKNIITNKIYSFESSWNRIQWNKLYMLNLMFHVQIVGCVYYLYSKSTVCGLITLCCIAAEIIFCYWNSWSIKHKIFIWKGYEFQHLSYTQTI